jgi:3-hydroxyisobutyrate dehydrogenase
MSGLVTGPAGLTEIWGRMWSELDHAVKNRRHAWHTLAVATSGLPGPSVRTVVLRGVNREEGLVVFHTDRRAPKIGEIRAHPTVGLLFYDPQARVQLRFRARAVLHMDDEIAAAAWERTPAGSRRCYLAEAAPGSPCESPEGTLPKMWRERTPPLEETGPGWENFAVVHCRVEEADWLQLNAHGHERALFQKDAGGLWQGRWIQP